MTRGCPECGSVVPELDELDDLRRLCAEQEEQIGNLTHLAAQEANKVARMKVHRAEQQKLNPFREDAEQVYDHWKARLSPKSREFKGKRFEAVVARLAAGWDVADLKVAVDGCARSRWHVDHQQKDLELICRDEEHLLMFMEKGGVVRESREPAPANPTLEKAYEKMRADLHDGIVARLVELRGWTPAAVHGLGLGYDSRSRRIVFPAYDENATLTGLSRYQPNVSRRGRAPKNIASGERELFPAPESLDVKSVWLVEGEPDSVSMASIGQPAIGVPGVAIWKEGWAERFARFERVRICFDCDDEGKTAADARQKALIDVVDTVDVVRLDSRQERDDHYDVGDLVLEYGDRATSELTRCAVGESTVQRLRQPSFDSEKRWTVPPWERITKALEDYGSTVKEQAPGRAEANCPAHDDAHASLSLAEDSDRKVLLHCHAGCETEAILEKLGIEWGELFAA